MIFSAILSFNESKNKKSGTVLNKMDRMNFETLNQI